MGNADRFGVAMRRCPTGLPGAHINRIAADLLLFMDDDAAAAQSGRRIGVVRLAHVVIVDETPRAGDLDSEPVHAPTTANLPIDGREQEIVIPGSVDRAGALELRAGSRDDQPLIRVAVE